MPTALTAQRGIDQAASTTPIPRLDVTLQLSARTVAWLADRPRARELVGSVWDKLAELERAGHHPGAIAALRFVLIHHQPPSPTGRCRSCRRFTWRRLWRRRSFPCMVWRQVRGELLGPLASGDHPRTPDTTQPFEPLLDHPSPQTCPKTECDQRRPRNSGD
jgi:hypothetical protein